MKLEWEQKWYLIPLFGWIRRVGYSLLSAIYFTFFSHQPSTYITVSSRKLSFEYWTEINHLICTFCWLLLSWSRLLVECYYIHNVRNSYRNWNEWRRRKKKVSDTYNNGKRNRSRLRMKCVTAWICVFGGMGWIIPFVWSLLWLFSAKTTTLGKLY